MTNAERSTLNFKVTLQTEGESRVDETECFNHRWTQMNTEGEGNGDCLSHETQV